MQLYKAVLLQSPEGGSVLIQTHSLHSIHFASNSLQIFSSKMMALHRAAAVVIFSLMWPL